MSRSDPAVRWPVVTLPVTSAHRACGNESNTRSRASTTGSRFTFSVFDLATRRPYSRGAVRLAATYKPVAQGFGFGMGEVVLVVHAGPGGDVAGDVRGEDPAAVHGPGLRGQVPLPSQVCPSMVMTR